MTTRNRVLAVAGGMLLTAVLTGCAQKATPSTSLGNAPGQPGAGNVHNGPGAGQGNAPVPHGSTTPAPYPSASSSSSGSGGSGSGGTGGGGPHPPYTFNPTLVFTFRPPIIPAQDCISYNPATLTIVNSGAIGFTTTDGSSAMLLMDSVADADIAITLLHNYNQQCFIGRDNSYTGSERYRHIIDYWQGSGVPGSSVPTPDCLPYDNTALAINNLGSDYQLAAAGQPLLLTADMADADAAKALAAAHHQLCFIGRSNSRSDRYEYIVEYWI
jgi:hypothetical protein